MKIEKKTLVKETHSVSLGHEALRRLFHEAGFTVPEDASIFVMVPGGGDWSHRRLDIEDDCPLQITWTLTEES